MGTELNDRLFQFAVDTIKFLKCFPNKPEYNVIKYQLSKSSTSSGANYEEAQGASSRADFLNKERISLKEMRESNYWLRIIKALDIGDKVLSEQLFNESEELKKILGSICSKLGNPTSSKEKV